jgi:hypothetical protein
MGQIPVRPRGGGRPRWVWLLIALVVIAIIVLALYIVAS